MPSPEETGTAHSLRIGLTQWHATTDTAANLDVACALITEAGEAGADLVVLPENGLMLGTNTQMREAALPVDSPEIDRLRAAAPQAGCAVVLGGFKRRDRAGTVHNTALVIDADGGIAGGYDKIHLFDATVAGQSFQASRVEQRGDRPALLELGGARIGLSICFDVRFPELYRQLALAGAEVMLVPSAFTAKTGEAHWEVLLRARAIENAAYVVASATVHDPHGNTDAFPTYGHGVIVDPWGTVLTDLGQEPRAVRVVELDLHQVRSVRESLPVLRGVQPQAYQTPAETMTLATSRSREKL
jgi:predicted amidohydrolase